MDSNMTQDTPQAAALDLLVITNLLAGSAISSDVSSEVFQLGLYAEHAVMDRSASLPNYVGREDIAAIMREPEHVEFVERGLLHLAAQPYVRLAGDTAVACGYLQVVRTDPQAAESADDSAGGAYVSTGPSLWMVTANVWRFERIDGEWLMVSRTIRDALSAEGRDLVRGVLEAA
jgi:hypothetical protein